MSKFEIDDTGMPVTERSTQFIQGMVSRMGVSYHKYGRVKDAYPKKINALQSMQQRLDRYAEDGNTEWLMDAANFLMIEFMHPAHKSAHYDPQDSDTSPGRTGNNGRRSVRDNHGRVWEQPDMPKVAD